MAQANFDSIKNRYKSIGNPQLRYLSTSDIKAFTSPGDGITKILVDSSYSRKIKSASRLSLGASQASRNEGLEPGDVALLFSGSSLTEPAYDALAHAAVYIDENLFYEKTGPASENIYRLVTFEDLLKATEDSQTWIFRRYTESVSQDFAKIAAGNGTAQQ